jgi:protein required for attachment to host cells
MSSAQTQVRIPANALVMVGDGAKALFLRNTGSEQQPHLEVEDVLSHSRASTRDQGSDKPGRQGVDGPRGGATPAGHGSSARGAIEQTDWHSLEEARFAAEVADGLYRAAHAGRFRDLVVVAPPATLGELRRQFHREVTERVVAEVAKDLTGHETAQIEKLLTRH